MENKFISKSSGHGQFDFDENGVFRIAGIPAFMMCMTSRSIQHELLFKYIDRKKAKDVLYYTGKCQGIVAVRLLRDKFGIKSKKQIFDNIIDQLSMIGLGKSNVMVFNEKTKHVILRRDVSPFAENYKSIFGYQKEPVCNFFRGDVAGVLEELFGEKIIVIEKQCKAQGKPYCLIESFTLPMLNEKSLSDSEKNQIPGPEDDYPDLLKLTNTHFYLK